MAANKDKQHKIHNESQNLPISQRVYMGCFPRRFTNLKLVAGTNCTNVI